MRYATMLVLAAAVSTARAEAPAKDAGGEVYAKKCATCHAVDGKGKAAMAKMFKIEPAALDLTAETVAKKADADLVKMINEGKNKMPAFKGKLTEAEISAVLGYVRAFAAKPAAKPEGAK